MTDTRDIDNPKASFSWPRVAGTAFAIALHVVVFLMLLAPVSSQKAAEEENRVPSPEVLATVMAGGRGFTNAQREWCVGEAMVLSGFAFTPMELIEQGDAKIAKIISDAQRR